MNKTTKTILVAIFLPSAVSVAYVAWQYFAKPKVSISEVGKNLLNNVYIPFIKINVDGKDFEYNTADAKDYETKAGIFNKYQLSIIRPMETEFLIRLTTRKGKVIFEQTVKI